MIIKQILGQPLVPDEKVYFSIPAMPIDNPPVNIEYHTETFIHLQKKIGYVGSPINEAYAIVHSEGEDFGYSCMAISWGAGLTNVGMANEIWEIDSFKFSVSRGGDYIDRGVSDSLRIPITRVILEKEGVLVKRRRLPFTASDVILAKSPMTSVAKGLRIKLEMDKV